MKVLFDTNVILDVLLDREPFAEDSSYLLEKVERSEIVGFVCATTITTIHYLAAKALGSKVAATHIYSLLSLFAVAPVNRLVLQNAANSKFKDFQDAALHEAAIHAGVGYIVTRNTADFKKSQLPVLEPRELIHALESLKE
jgi:predicted nucleic acid-binding protein